MPSSPPASDLPTALQPTNAQKLAISEGLAQAILGASRVAVRSSATAEDGLNRSFAGVFDSVLNADGLAAVVSAVGQVWRSCNSPRALAYCRRFGVDPKTLRMAVIVQRMVRAQWAGTMFSRNPLTGSAETVLIEYRAGNGAPIAAGSVLPTRLVMNRRSRAPESQQGDMSVTLSRSAVGSLLDVLESIEDVLGESALDIEWSIEDSAVWVLQARPLTALPGHFETNAAT